MTWVLREKFWKINKKNQNVVDGNIVTDDVKNSLIKINDESVAVVIGVNNLIIVKEKDALLVTKKNYHKNTKDLLKKIKKKQREI